MPGVVAPAGTTIDEAHDDGCIPRSSGQTVQHGDVVAYESRTEHEVLGWIAGHCQFGQEQDVGLHVGCPLHGVEDPLLVAVEVADTKVDLSARDAKEVHEERG
jgi:hypothetical protein